MKKVLKNILAGISYIIIFLFLLPILIVTTLGNLANKFLEE